MVYVENIFDKEFGLNKCEYIYEDGNLLVLIRFGSFTYNRTMSISDLQSSHIECIEIYENDIKLIKSYLRDEKLKDLGI